VAFYEEDGITAIPLATQSKSITLDTSTGEDPLTATK
jgi:major type 1 subunit fimbrin (pilin)